MNKSNRTKYKSQTHKSSYRGYTDKKPTKIIIDSSKKVDQKNEEEKKVQNNINEDKKEELSLNQEKINRDKIIHENNLRVIEMLQADLDKDQKESELLLREIESLKEQKKQLEETFEKIRDDIENEKTELEELRDINDSKNREYIQLMHLRHQNIMNNPNINSSGNNRNNNTNSNNNNNESSGEASSGLTLGDVMDGLLFSLSRMRGENGEGDSPFIFIHGNDTSDDGPPMSYSQINNLPVMNYPRNNNNNEKCTLCGFEFFYNDLVTKLVKCNHTFHKTCLANRLSAIQGSKCPICKISII